MDRKLNDPRLPSKSPSTSFQIERATNQRLSQSKKQLPSMKSVKLNQVGNIKLALKELPITTREEFLDLMALLELASRQSIGCANRADVIFHYVPQFLTRS